MTPDLGALKERPQILGVYRTCALSMVLLFLAGCQQSEPIDLLAEGERLCLESLWPEAIPVLKEHLLGHPDDGGAHFYLGRCYMMAGRLAFRPALALGEFQTALALFHRSGESSPISRFTDEYFQYICHLEMAKVRISEIDKLQAYGARLWQLKELIQLSRDHLEEARRTRPDDPDVDGISDIIRRLEWSSRRGSAAKAL